MFCYNWQKNKGKSRFGHDVNLGLGRGSLKGFTLIEVLVASFLLVTVIVMTAGPFIFTKDRHNRIKHKYMAVDYAQAWIEELKSRGFNDTSLDTSGAVSYPAYCFQPSPPPATTAPGLPAEELLNLCSGQCIYDVSNYNETVHSYGVVGKQVNVTVRWLENGISFFEHITALVTDY